MAAAEQRADRRAGERSVEDDATGTALGRRAFAVVAWLFVACLVVQFFLVGLDVFEALGDSELHRDFAYTYGWLAPVLVLLAGLAGVPRRVLVLSVALLVLYAVQTYLPLMADALPGVAAVHAVNALLVFWVAVRLARAVAWNPEDGGTPDA
jgi:Family of unknown function (DUF6220)